MANEISGITGSDQIAPVQDTNRLWRIWNLAELYVGTVGKGRYVPNKHDWAIDLGSRIKYEVVDIDPTTAIPDLREIADVPSGVLQPIDVLFGTGPGTQADTFRIYCDKSVVPFTLAIDSRARVAGTQVQKAKIFRGNIVGGDWECISAQYDQSGNLLGEEIPLEIVAAEGNVSIKVVPLCHTSANLAEGELVVVRFYSAGGHVMSTQQLLVVNTAFQRAANAAVKYISSIELESPFMSDSDPTLIKYPINVLLQGINLIGVINYSDGSQRRLPVDGSKFEVFGMRSYAASVVGQKLPITLKYNLSPDEVAYGAGVGEGRHMTAKYTAQTGAVDGAYSVKLFGFPVWINNSGGYRMEWFLYNLDRKVVFLATPHVRINENTGEFDGTAYGRKQRLSVNVKLSDVSPMFNDWRHIQTIEISLLAPAHEQTTNWMVGFDPNQDPAYGRDNHVKYTMINQNLRKLNLTSGETNQANWLERFYSRVRPLFNDQTEIEAPKPTHFALVFGTTEVEYPISQWADDLLVSNTINDGDTLFVKFFKRMAVSDIHLAVAGIPVYIQNT